MIAGYPLAQVRKAVVAALVVAISLAAFFITFPVGFQVAATVVVGQVFVVVGVFLAKNHTPDDVNKAVTALAGGVISLVSLFTTVNLSQVQVILAIVSQVILAFAVHQTANG